MPKREIWIGSICCGRALTSSLYAAEEGQGRYQIRQLVEPTWAMRVGTVTGGNRRYVAENTWGELLGTASSLKAAAELLQKELKGKPFRTLRRKLKNTPTGDPR